VARGEREVALRCCAVSATGSESSIARAEAPGTEPPVRIELVVITALAVVAGLVLRFTTRSALWLDEALSVNLAELPMGDIAGALRHDGHPPLYYYLLHGWIGLVGNGDVAVRSLSGVIAVATLPLAYVAGRRAGGRALGLVTLGIFALTPYLIRYATETRMYALVMFGVLVAYLLVDDIVRRGRSQWWRVAALALTVGALLWTHYWALWPTAALALVLLWTWRRSDRPEARSGAARALVALVGGGVLFLPWVPTLLFQSAHTGTPWAGPVRPAALLALTFTDLGGGSFNDAQFVGAVLVVLVLLGVFGRAISARRIELDLRGSEPFRAEAAVLAITILLGLLVTYATWSAYVSRYAAVFVPILLLLAAAGITRFVGRWVRFGAYVVTLGLLAMGGVFNITFERTQTKSLAPIVADRMVDGDVVVTCPDQLGPATMRALPSGLIVVGYPTLDPPVLIDWTDYGDRPPVDPDTYAAAVLELAGPDHTVAMVWSATYITHTGTCEALLEAFGRQRPAQTVANQNGALYYESANLTLFPPAP
jgi:mannosyltransferase